eukprot:SAG11_NODE_4852_length_1746_cov_1.557984_1_plen_141_part_00
MVLYLRTTFFVFVARCTSLLHLRVVMILDGHSHTETKFQMLTPSGSSINLEIPPIRCTTSMVCSAMRKEGRREPHRDQIKVSAQKYDHVPAFVSIALEAHFSKKHRHMSYVWCSKLVAYNTAVCHDMPEQERCDIALQTT